VKAKRLGDRLRQRGKIVTNLLTLGMLESTAEADKPAADRSGKLPDQVGALAVDLVKRVMPHVDAGEAPRVLVVLDDANRGENAEDAARIQQSLQELLTRTQARLEVEIRAGVEVTVTRIQAIIEDELSRMSLELVEKRTTVRLLVATTLIVTTTKAEVELVNEPASGLSLEGIRMKDGKRPHAVWFSNPGQPIDDASTIHSLVRFSQRGGGVIVQGDDAAQGTKALTGLELRGSWAEANGHIYCGQNYDNGAGRYPLASESLSVAGLVYTDDLDFANVVDPRVRVIASSTPTCRGATEKLPAIVFIDADEQ
jgi:hypothetical protein